VSFYRIVLLELLPSSDGVSAWSLDLPGFLVFYPAVFNKHLRRNCLLAGVIPSNKHTNSSINPSRNKGRGKERGRRRKKKCAKCL
ncbi:Uncharacterized protein APZ42_002892, partial [Daphnia magna]